MEAFIVIVKDCVDIVIRARNCHDCSFCGRGCSGDKNLLTRNKGGRLEERTAFVEFIEVETAVIVQVECQAGG